MKKEEGNKHIILENLEYRFFSLTWDTSDNNVSQYMSKTDFSYVSNRQKSTLRMFKTDENRRFVHLKPTKTDASSVLKPTKTDASYVFKPTKTDQNDEKNVRALIGVGEVKPTKTDYFLCLNPTKISTREYYINHWISMKKYWFNFFYQIIMHHYSCTLTPPLSGSDVYLARSWKINIWSRPEEGPVNTNIVEYCLIVYINDIYIIVHFIGFFYKTGQIITLS